MISPIYVVVFRMLSVRFVLLLFWFFFYFVNYNVNKYKKTQLAFTSFCLQQSLQVLGNKSEIYGKHLAKLYFLHSIYTLCRNKRTKNFITVFAHYK